MEPGGTATVTVHSGHPAIRDRPAVHRRLGRAGRAAARLPVARGVAAALADFVEMTQTEPVVVDEHTDIRQLGKELRWNQMYHRLTPAP